MIELARPAFLVAGAMLAMVPPLLHLIARRPPDRAPLPTVRFLRPDPRTSVRMRRRPNDLVLLLLRSALLLLVGAAFAGLSWAPRRSGTVELVLLDRGRGMVGAWPAAVDSARAVLLSGGVPQGGLVLFDTAAVHVPAPQLSPVYFDSLAAAGPGEVRVDYATAFRGLRSAVQSLTSADSVRVSLVTRPRWEGWSPGLTRLRRSAWSGTIHVVRLPPAGSSLMADDRAGAPFARGRAVVLARPGAGIYVEAALGALEWDVVEDRLGGVSARAAPVRARAEGETIDGEGGAVGGEGGTISEEDGTVGGEGRVVREEGGAIREDGGAVDEESETVSAEGKTVEAAGGRIGLQAEKIDVEGQTIEAEGKAAEAEGRAGKAVAPEGAAIEAERETIETENATVEADLYVILRQLASAEQSTLLERARAGATVVVAGVRHEGDLAAALPWTTARGGEVGHAVPGRLPRIGRLVFADGPALAGAAFRVAGTAEPRARVIAVRGDGRPAAVAAPLGSGCLVFLSAGLEGGRLPLAAAFPAAIQRLAFGCEARPRDRAPQPAGRQAPSSDLRTASLRTSDLRPLDGGALAVLEGSGAPAVPLSAVMTDIQAAGGDGLEFPTDPSLTRWMLVAALCFAVVETFLAYRRRQVR